MVDVIAVLLFFIFALADSQAELTSYGDLDVSGLFDDINTSLDLFDLDDELLSMSTDLADETTSWLILDSDTDLWADVSDECSSENALSMNEIQRRDNFCSPRLETPNQPNKNSNPDLINFPGIGTKPLAILTSDDQDICQTLDVYDASYYAVCDSGREEDRVFNSRTGEWSIFHCERRKLRYFSNEFTSWIYPCQAAV